MCGYTIAVQLFQEFTYLFANFFNFVTIVSLQTWLHAIFVSRFVSTFPNDDKIQIKYSRLKRI